MALVMDESEQVNTFLVNRAHKIRLWPEPEQERLMILSCDATRFAYNWGLSRWEEIYADGGKPSALSLKKEFNARKKEEFPWVLEVAGRCTEFGFTKLGNSFRNFFRRLKQKGESPGYPKFKSRYHSHQSFYAANIDIRIKDKKIRLPKIGWVSMAENFRFGYGRILSAIVSRDGDRWFVSLTSELAIAVNKNEGPAVGIDFSVKNLAYLSDGTIIPVGHKKKLDRSTRKIAKLQKKLVRQKKLNPGGSNGIDETRKRINDAHYKIRCLREDALHKATSEIATDYGFIVFEGFNVRDLIAGSHRPKGLTNSAIGEARRQLGYKSIVAGGETFILPEGTNTNGICSLCGCDNGDVSPHVIEWVCVDCGAILNRHENSAKNILEMGIHLAEASRA